MTWAHGNQSCWDVSKNPDQDQETCPKMFHVLLDVEKKNDSNHEVSSLFFLLLLEECLEYFYVLLLLLHDNYEIKLKRFGSKIIVKLCPGSAKLKRPYLGSMPAFGIFWATPCHLHWVGLRLYQLLWVVALVHPIRIPCNILCDMIWCLILFLSSSRSLVKKKKAEEMYLGFYAIVHHWLDVSMKNT